MKTTLAMLVCVAACCLNAPVLGRYYDSEIKPELNDLLELLAQDIDGANKQDWARSAPSGPRLREDEPMRMRFPSHMTCKMAVTKPGRELADDLYKEPKLVERARSPQHGRNLRYDDFYPGDDETGWDEIADEDFYPPGEWNNGGKVRN